MKIETNIHWVKRVYMINFEHFCNCHKGEKAMSLRESKTFGSPFISNWTIQFFLDRIWWEFIKMNFKTIFFLDDTVVELRIVNNIIKYSFGNCHTFIRIVWSDYGYCINFHLIIKWECVGLKPLALQHLSV